MTIRRSLHPVTLITYANTLSPYGEQLYEVDKTTTIELAIEQYMQTNINTPKYEDIHAVATSLTDYHIKPGSEIIDNDVHYRVKLVIPGRRHMLLLQRL